MEQLGIRTASVRQETAVIIASVAPSHTESSAPRTSKEMEEILPRRRLPESARRRQRLPICCAPC
jgi:hypothetical protein